VSCLGAVMRRARVFANGLLVHSPSVYPYKCDRVPDKVPLGLARRYRLFGGLSSIATDSANGQPSIK
jgi:hypothetical protein